MYNVGCALPDGEGCRRDRAEAAEWFKAAAEKGVVPAMHNMGMRCMHGEGVEFSLEEAFK